MSFHKSLLGSFGGSAAAAADINGLVPTADTTAFELTYDHGTEATHTETGELTPYGEWWQDERFPELKLAAITATEQAEAMVYDWQQNR